MTMSLEFISRVNYKKEEKLIWFFRLIS